MAEQWITINGAAVLVNEDGSLGGQVGQNIMESSEMGDQSSEEKIKEATEYFGTTTNMREAGYLTPNGDYLDFSGRHEGADDRDIRGTRNVDHRAVQDIYDSSGTDAMIDFINDGAIRLSPESGGMEMSKMPTNEQLMSLMTYVNHFNGGVTIDFADASGKVVDFKQYPERTSASRVIADIRKHFE